jgi:phospholipid-binding lipoprotein MlaA
MRSKRARVRLLLASAMAFELAAAPALAQAVEPYDPWEPFNRKMYAIHRVLDGHIFGPIARTYGRLPDAIRKPISNFTTNLSEPVVFVNDVLQGRIPTAARTVARFTMNTTAGIAGFRDVAVHNHLPHHDNGFGVTLGRWGAGPGPYIFIPIVGPSDLRDTIGMIGTVATNPFTWAQFEGKTGLTLSTGIVNGLNVRYEAEPALSNIDQTSTDPYATLRSYFLQNREALIRGNPAEPEALPEFDIPDIPSEGAAPGGTSAAPSPEPAPPAAQQPAAPASPPAAAQPAPEPAPQPAPTPSPGQQQFR